MSDFEYWYNRGKDKYREGIYEESISCFEKALALNPSRPRYIDVYNGLGECYYKLGNIDLTLTYLVKSEEIVDALCKEDVSFMFDEPDYNIMADCYHQIEDLSNAEKYYKITIDEDEPYRNYGDQILRLGKFYLDINKNHEAIKTFKWGLKYTKNSEIELLYNLATTHEKSGEFDKATELYKEVKDMVAEKGRHGQLKYSRLAQEAIELIENKMSETEAEKSEKNSAIEAKMELEEQNQPAENQLPNILNMMGTTKNLENLNQLLQKAIDITKNAQNDDNITPFWVQMVIHGYNTKKDELVKNIREDFRKFVTYQFETNTSEIYQNLNLKED